MNPKCVSAAVGLVAALLIATTQPQSMVAAGVPAAIHYQGRVAVSGAPFDGIGKFKFALVGPGAAAGSVVTYWSHDGTSENGSEPASSVAVKVTRGIYNVFLGDSDVPGMKLPLSAGVFDHEEVELRVWFGGGDDPIQLVAPDQRVGSVAFALVAEEARKAREVADGAIGTRQLGDRSVTAAKIQPGAVGAGQLNEGAVTTGKIAPRAVGRDQLADRSVDATKLVPGSITSELLGDGALSGLKIQPGTVGEAQLAQGAVTSAKIANGSITAGKLAPVLGGTIRADRFEGDGSGLGKVVSGMQDLRVVMGLVQANGNIIRGTGFQVSKTRAGNYTIQFATPFADVPMVVANASSVGGTVTWNNPNPSLIELTTAVGGHVEDSWFTFMAIGPR